MQYFLKYVPYDINDNNTIQSYINEFMNLIKLINEKDHKQLINFLNEPEILNLLEYINKTMELISNGTDSLSNIRDYRSQEPMQPNIESESYDS